jgi:two-component system chemotaxis sensor kinase CheA
MTKAEREFVSEAEEILDRLRSEMLELETQRARDGDELDPDLVNRAFRSAHTLKGLAGMAGHDAMSELAHRLEDVLDGVRMGRVGADSPALAIVDEAIELCSELLAGSGEAAGGDLSRVAELIGRLDVALSGGDASRDDEEPVLDIDPNMLRALTEYEEHRLQENVRKGRHLSLVDTNFDIASFEEGLGELSAAIREVGEVVSTLPSPGDAQESQIRFSLLAATTVSAEQLSERLDFPETTVRIVRQGGDREAGSPVEREPAAGLADKAVGPSAGPEGTDAQSFKSISDTVRVDIRKLDELMTLVGELVIQRSAVASISDRLAARSDTARLGLELSKVDKQLDRKLKELQTGVLEVRMVPLRQVFQKLSRVARRLERDLGRQVRLDFVGGDTELDKLIVEELVDPLVHLLRNAIDHAIEPSSERRAAGKPAEGQICVAASQRGNHVVITVSDDGRGIDPVAVRARAEAAGLIAPDAAVPDTEILALVFEPGLSTRAEVSETSGRGVGMDVVRSNITSLGGLVDLESRLGHGSVITLTLPITLAIVQALLVEVAEQRFAVPLASVLETLMVSEDEIQRSEGRELLNLRGKPLPLRRLADEFGLQSQAERSGGEDLCAVVLGLGELRMGLLVDALLGQQDTVIKPIQGPVRQVRGIAGATELGDGDAVLVLDVSSFVEDTVRGKETA